DLDDQTAKRFGGLTAADSERKEALQGLKQDTERLQQELGKLSGRLDAVNGSLTAIAKTIGTRLDEQEKSFRTSDGRTAALAQQLDTQNRAVTEQITQLSRALSDFKQALHALGDKFVQDGQAASTQSVQLGRRLDGLQAKVE